MRWTTCRTLRGVGVACLGLAKLTNTLTASDASGVKGVAFGYCCMGDAVEGDAMNERCLPVLVYKIYGDRWVITRVVPRKGPEEYAVKATAEDLQQSGKCRCLCSFRWSDQIIEAAHSSTVERNSWAG